MWARVKGSTENALLRLPFDKAAVMICRGDCADARNQIENGAIQDSLLCVASLASRGECGGTEVRNDD